MKRTLKYIKEYGIIVLLGFLSAVNYVIFIINNKFAPAGINGIATMVQYFFPVFNLGYFSLIINIPLCILAYIFVNKTFAIKSFVYTLVYSISYSILYENNILEKFVYKAEGTDVLIPVLSAAIISGFIYGNIFRVNASTGGTDIIAKLISKKRPEFNFVYVIFTLNAIVAAISYFVFAYNKETGEMVYNLKPVLLCIGYCFVSSRIGNSILQGSKQAVKFEVITDQPEELSKRIIEELHHSVTMKKVVGMYSHSEHQQLTCIVNKHQIADFQKILEEFPNSFAYITPVNEMIGNFKHIKKEEKKKA